MNQKVVKGVLTDRPIRAAYDRDAAHLIAASHVVVVNFQTVAAANGYWKGCVARVASVTRWSRAQPTECRRVEEHVP